MKKKAFKFSKSFAFHIDNTVKTACLPNLGSLSPTNIHENPKYTS